MSAGSVVGSIFNIIGTSMRHPGKPIEINTSSGKVVVVEQIGTSSGKVALWSGTVIRGDTLSSEERENIVAKLQEKEIIVKWADQEEETEEDESPESPLDD